MKDKISAEARRSKLIDLRTDLTARLASIETELESHQNPDWEDLATEREDDEVLEARGLSGQQELRQIDAALQRIADGTYGMCAKCGSDIDGARLATLPATPFCRTCAA